MDRKADLQALIVNKSRRWQKLKEQQALKGIDTPAHVLIELEDLAIEMDRLQAELIDLPAAFAAGIGQNEVNLPPLEPLAAAEAVNRLPLLKNGSRFMYRFTIEGFIGRGGFSDVYLAWDQVKDEAVVVKRLPRPANQADFLNRFVEREIKIARRLAPLTINGLVKTYEIIQGDGEVCLVQERQPGRSLHQRLRDKVLIDETEAVETTIKVSQTLAELHRHNLVHGDIKPLNIVLRAPGQPLVIDLGAARFFNEALEAAQIVFSLPYAAPELLTGQPVDGRVDIYALGLTLLHMLTGLPAFDDMDDTMPLPEHIRVGRRPNRQTIRQHITAALVMVTSANLRRIIETAVAELPADRYPAMEIFGQALIAPS
ncbi:MAG: serine/threonine protein kinase [Anaerolineaceae bacterium]|nr:serine/threonine protein kinase [Anaerolineaceae bacterium]MCB9101393.1 serine/threonine protein kinase [Anaerolineales bacterium]